VAFITTLDENRANLLFKKISGNFVRGDMDASDQSYQAEGEWVESL
jgi:hypothetical protein